MNIGERIKQIRAEKNLTQPQLAETIGIEQSYLSKLENDKSSPSADIFQLLLKGLEMTAAEFLQGIDKDSMHKQLKHIPEVASHMATQTTIKVHSVKKWLYTSAVLCILGLTLIVGGYRGLIFSNTVYQYESLGITKPDEPKELFFDDRIRHIFLVKTIWPSNEQHNIVKTFESERRDVQIILKDQYLGDGYIEKVEGGFRMFRTSGSHNTERVENRWLMLTGFLLTFCGLFGFITEYRLRKLQI
jgi:transcriptional regulator with XRE-family HTH domain